VWAGIPHTPGQLELRVYNLQRPQFVQRTSRTLSDIPHGPKAQRLTKLVDRDVGIGVIVNQTSQIL
jgi:hypothetical protein